MCANFQTKRTTLTFWAQICPKRNLGLEIQKTNVGIRVSILEIPCVPIFRQNKQLWLFDPKFVKKWILGSEFQKSKSGFGLSTCKRPSRLKYADYLVHFELFNRDIRNLEILSSENLDFVKTKTKGTALSTFRQYNKNPLQNLSKEISVKTRIS